MVYCTSIELHFSCISERNDDTIVWGEVGQRVMIGIIIEVNDDN